MKFRATVFYLSDGTGVYCQLRLVVLLFKSSLPSRILYELCARCSPDRICLTILGNIFYYIVKLCASNAGVRILLFFLSRGGIALVVCYFILPPVSSPSALFCTKFAKELFIINRGAARYMGACLCTVSISWESSAALLVTSI